MPLDSSPESPIPVRAVARMIGDWVAKLGRVWVEGQVTQLTSRKGTGIAFITLRDTATDMSLSVTCPRALLGGVQPPIAQGARIVVYAHPDFYLPRGTLALKASDIRHVGVGELLARLERLRRTLEAEGLFAAARKRPLPFLPRSVGLVTGRGSAAERDVLEVARRRWPRVSFRVENVPVQGAYAVPKVVAALRLLDADPDVEVIVLARGGGSVEDLLTFSDETLCRAVSDCHTPVVSAIGHETDTPLVDFVADVRAATPTDAAKRVVPDAAQEGRAVATLRGRAHRAVSSGVQRERLSLGALRSRPVLARPQDGLRTRLTDVTALRQRSLRTMRNRVTSAASDLTHARARVIAMSPAATLARGYAVVQTPDGAVVRTVGGIAPGDELRVRLSDGALAVHVDGAAHTS